MTKFIQIDKTLNNKIGNGSNFKLIVKRYKNNVKNSFVSVDIGNGIILKLNYVSDAKAIENIHNV